MRFRLIIILILAFVLPGTVWAEDGLTLFRAEQTNNEASPPNGAGNTPTNDDFFSQLIAALQTISDGGGQKITLDYKFPDGTFGSLAGKAQLVLQQPDLHTKLAKDLASNAATLKTLKDELTYGDDVSVTFGISPQAKTAAERVQRAWFSVQDALVQRRTSQIMSARRDAAVRARAAVATDDDPALELGAFDAALRREPLPVAGEMRSLSADTDPIAELDVRRAAARSLLREGGALAANQSKFVFNASYRDRRDTVGQDEWFVKTSYEYGPGTNVEKRIRQAQADCVGRFRQRAALRDNDPCVESYRDALLQAAADPNVVTGTRVTFALEYHDLSAVKTAIANTNPAYTFELADSRSIVASLAAGRDVFPREPDPKDPTAKLQRVGRIELTVSYDDVSGDKNRQDKFIGKLTYSHRITEKLYIPITLAYANHSDYLADVDRKLNAHFGIAYKLPSKP